MINQIIQGDCRQNIKNLPDNSVHAILMDAPYFLASQPNILDVIEAFKAGESYHGAKGFMGREWDSFALGPDFTAEFYRVLKPGGALVSFMSPRNDDLLKLALRWVGFRIEESGVWLYGSDFPKGKGKLKSLIETIIFAQKPIEKGLTIEQNFKEWGTGKFDIEAGRVGGSGGTKKIVLDKNGASVNTYGNGLNVKHKTEQLNKGRHPSKTLLSHSPYCRLLGLKKIKAKSGDVGAGKKIKQVSSFGINGTRPEYQRPVDENGMETVENWDCVDGCPVKHINQMGNDDETARYFYNGKSSTKERHAGLQDFYWLVDDSQPVGYKRISKTEYEQLPPDLVRSGNIHPTVKPYGILEYLLKLIGKGLIFDPFAGSCSLAIAATYTGNDFICMELNSEYVDIGKARLQYARQLWQLGKKIEDATIKEPVEVKTKNGVYKQKELF